MLRMYFQGKRLPTSKRHYLHLRKSIDKNHIQLKVKCIWSQISQSRHHLIHHLYNFKKREPHNGTNNYTHRYIHIKLQIQNQKLISKTFKLQSLNIKLTYCYCFLKQKLFQPDKAVRCQKKEDKSMKHAMVSFLPPLIEKLWTKNLPDPIRANKSRLYICKVYLFMQWS